MGFASDVVKVIITNIIAFFTWLTVSFVFNFTTNITTFIYDRLVDIDPSAFGKYQAQFNQNISDASAFSTIWNAFPLVISIASFLWLIARAKKSDEVEITQYMG